MSSYEPTSRRPIADAFRGTADRAVRLFVRLGIHPDVVSCASLVASAAAAVCFWQAQNHPALLIPAVGLCYLRLWFNMLDGMVAIAAGKASRRGEIFNEVPDRISDVVIFVGVAHSGLCHPMSGYWVAIFCLLVAYVGTLGQALAGRREFGGLMTKPWRMVALHVGAWITLAALWWRGGEIIYASLTILDWTNLVIIAGCIQTIASRLRRTWKELESDDRAAGSEDQSLEA